jgi:hypothetical protein
MLAKGPSGPNTSREESIQTFHHSRLKGRHRPHSALFDFVEHAKSLGKTACTKPSMVLLTISLPTQYYSPNTTGWGLLSSAPWTGAPFFPKNRHRAEVALVLISLTLPPFRQLVIEYCYGNSAEAFFHLPRRIEIIYFIRSRNGGFGYRGRRRLICIKNHAW